MSVNYWGPLTSVEGQKNEEQFLLLQPLNDFISGDQVRPFFLKSGLPPNILAQIWQLSDLNKDGKLDRLEFSISMRLIRNSLAGQTLPATLPDTLCSTQQQPVQLQQFTPAQLLVRPTSAYGNSSFGVQPIQVYNMGGSMSTAAQYGSASVPLSARSPFIMGNKELGDWTIPQHLKLKFSQHFNQLDKNRIGMLTGAQARSVMGGSQLPMHILARIWTMSDVNKDGCLSIEEFCVAMFLIEQLKAGYMLPQVLPSELNIFCNRSKTASPLNSDPTAPPPQKNTLKTFEDKRRDNLDRGQAELERRRQILREEEDRRRAEIERKEREESERRERERMELERRRDQEREIERLREQEREKERAVEEERLRAEREETRKRVEVERFKELEKIRIRDLELQKQSDIEKTTQIQHRHKTMTFQLQALEEKSQQLNGEITTARDGVIRITSEIEKMRESRDEKFARINELTTRSQTLAVQCERIGHENLQLQTECQRTLSRTQEIEKLNKLISEAKDDILTTEKEIDNANERRTVQAKVLSEKRAELQESNKKLQDLLSTYNQLVDKFNSKKELIEQKKTLQNLRPLQASIKSNSHLYCSPPDSVTTPASDWPISNAIDTNKFESNFAANFPKATSNGSISSSSNIPATEPQLNQPFSGDSPVKTNSAATGYVTVKYRALFEFVARSEDELNLQPGDGILVFEGHASEPGWLAGQIKEKVGWFPAAFAEPIENSANTKKSSITNMTTSPSSEPLASIKEEPSEKEFATDFKNAFFQNNSNTTTKPILKSNSITNGLFLNTVTTTSSALYEAPPIFDEPLYNKTSPEKTKALSDDKEEMVLAVGTALYQWKARVDGEMSFGRNDLIEILEQSEMRWRGRLQKKPEIKGWFPKSYVKLNLLEEETKSTHFNSQKSIENNLNDSNSATASNIDSHLTTNGEKAQDNWYIALYQFDAVEATDLPLRPGDRIIVTESKDEWWKGTCNGKSGIFPANYVQKVVQAAETGNINIGRAVAAFEATASNQISLKMGDFVRIHSTSQGGWWEGEVDRENGTKKTGWFPGNYIQVLESSKTGQNGEGNSFAIAIFDYEAQRLDELSFKTGDVLIVTDRTDTQWWRGKKEGDLTDVLLFPANFVQLRSTESASFSNSQNLCSNNVSTINSPNECLSEDLHNQSNEDPNSTTKNLANNENRLGKQTKIRHFNNSFKICLL